MAKRLTEHEIVEIAHKFEYAIEQVRSAAHETEWIDRLMREYPHLKVVDSVIDILVKKSIRGDFADGHHYSLENNRNNHLTDLVLRTFARETGLDLARLKKVTAEGDKIDQLMKDDNIDYVNALLKLY